MSNKNAVRVTLTGSEMGILLNNPEESMSAGKGLKKVIPTPEEEAARALYWTADKKSIAFPARGIHKGLIQASSGLKVPTNKKMPLGPIVAGDVFFSQDFMSLGTKEYEIYTTRAVVQGKGVKRSRPRIRNWRGTLDITWEGQFLGQGEEFSEGILRPLLEILGSRIGIGDFRPAKMGPFGKFNIESIKLI